MRYEDYLAIPGTPPLEQFTAGLKEQGRKAAAIASLEKRPDAQLSLPEQRAIDRQFEVNAMACRDAPAAEGRFPVILYHPGADGSFEENAALFEFLASHGYVVISSAFPMGRSFVSNTHTHPSVAIGDLRFLIQAASRLSFAEVGQIGAIGHSAGAQTILQWIGESDCPVQAFVSLDTTLEYTPYNFPGHRQLREKLAGLDPPRISVLLFATAERRPNFATFDPYLRHAIRYEASVSALRHDDYVSHGAMRAGLSAKDLPGVSIARIRESYRQVCVTIRSFLDAQWKKEDRGLNDLVQASSGAPDSHAIRVRFKAAR